MRRATHGAERRGGLADDPPPPGLEYSKARTPTFKSLEPLRPVLRVDQVRWITEQEPGLTAFEAPESSNLLHEHESVQRLDSIDMWASAFDKLVLPAVITPGTRAGYFDQWRSVVTFAYILNVLEELMPMSERVLKAFLLQLVLIGYRVGTIVSYVTAIKHRHRLWRVPFSIDLDALRDWLMAIRKNRGLPSTPKFKILPAHLKMAMQLPWSTLARLRDVVMFTIGTICALRASEVVELDVCDLSWDHDGPDTLMLRIKHLKNRKFREGLFPRIGASRNRRFDVLHMIRMYLRWAKLGVKEGCTKKAYPTDPCKTCGKLFRVMHPSGGSVQEKGVTKTHLTSAVHNVLQAIGVDSAGYSCISMREGGVSAAVIGCIPHDLRVMQTGHRSNAWEHYFDLADKTELYRFFNCFEM